MTDALKNHLVAVRENLKAKAYPNEASVRSHIIVPMLRALGWDTTDPRIVRHEYTLQAFRVDIGLFVPNEDHFASEESLKCIVELKAHGIIDADEQLFRYAFNAGAPIALLTDGQRFLFYCPFVSGGGYDERLVRQLDICEQSPDEVATALSRYLSFTNTRNGKAEHYAKTDLDSRKNTEKSRKHIPDAWQKLVRHDEEEQLIKLLTEETSTISKYAPDRGDVIEFLESLTSISGNRKVEIPPQPRPRQSHVARSERNTKPSGSKDVKYFLLGEELRAKSYAAVYREVLVALSAKDPYFLSRLEEQLTGRGGKKQISQQQEQVFCPGKAKKFNDTWWMNTSLTTQKITEILIVVCKVAHMPFRRKAGLLVKDISKPTSAIASSYLPQNRQQSNAAQQDPINRQRKPVVYYLAGEQYIARNAIEAYYDIIDMLAATHGESFMVNLEVALTHAGTGSKEIARSSGPPLRQTPSQPPVQLKCKWWVNRHLSNDAKRRFLHRACDIAGIPFDNKSGLWLGF